MKPRAMSVWIVAAASSAVCPPRSVQARVSFSPAVKNVIRPSASLRRRTTSSSADGPSRNSAASSSESSASSASSLQSIPRGPVLDGQQRLRRQRVELGRQLLRPVGERPPRVEVSEERLELSELGTLRRLARLRFLRDPLVAALDVVAVGDEQLELQGLEVVLGGRSVREAVEHREDRVDLAKVPE